MLSHAQIKLFKSLKQKKFRDKEQLILIEGYRLVQEAVQSKTPIQNVWVTEEFSQTEQGEKILNTCAEHDVRVEHAMPKELDRVCDSKHNQGVIALLPLPVLQDAVSVDITSPILMLDNISDPGNMGTLLRTANWYGVSQIIVSPHCVDVFNPKVMRAGMGAHFYIPHIIQTQLVDAIKILKQLGFAVLGADMVGKSLYKFHSPKKYALVLGNEAHGISSSLKTLFTNTITIPKNGQVESLNVASAGAIILDRLTSQ